MQTTTQMPTIDSMDLALMAWADDGGPCPHPDRPDEGNNDRSSGTPPDSDPEQKQE